MQIQSINCQSFESEKFRINKAYLEPSGIFSMSQYDADFFNPEQAEKWFIQAQRAKTVAERAECFEKMGEYRLIDRTQEKFMNQKFSKRNIFKMKIKDTLRMIEGEINGLFR